MKLVKKRQLQNEPIFWGDSSKGMMTHVLTAVTMQLGFNAKTQGRKGKKQFSIAEGRSPFGDPAL
jgi:hypothetical protein